VRLIIQVSADSFLTRAFSLDYKGWHDC